MSKLTYRFPELKDEAAAIKQMSPEQVGDIKNTVVNRLEHLKRMCDDYFDNLIESDCYFCESTGYAYFDLPEGWGWLSPNDAGTYLMCKECKERWELKHGTPPKLNREGEIKYEHSISEDSAHWRQADFEFV